MSDFRFRPCQHVRKQAEFDRAYETRLFAADDVLIINAAPNELAHARLGLSLSRKVGGAVVRNKWKRLIREAFRLSIRELPLGVDLVVRPQKDSEPELQAIRKSLIALGRRIARRLAVVPKAPAGESTAQRSDA
jgi:ribonuclease P protein component